MSRVVCLEVCIPLGVGVAIQLVGSPKASPMERLVAEAEVLEGIRYVLRMIRVQRSLENGGELIVFLFGFISVLSSVCPSRGRSVARSSLSEPGVPHWRAFDTQRLPRSSCSFPGIQLLQVKTPREAQKQQMDLLSPRNSELPKSSSISSLRDHLLASTTASASSSQQYGSYSSPRMGGGEHQHQASPMTPSANLPMTPESGSVLSPQVNAAATTPARKDSQLSSSSQSMDQETYSRQNSSSMGGTKGGVATPSQSEDDGGSNRTGIPPSVDSLLGIQDEAPLMGVQQSSPLSNSLRSGGGKSGGSNLSSPHTTQSPHGAGMLTPNVVVGGSQDGRSPAPVRPELLGFTARSPSFRSENQPSPLTEEAKMVSSQS